MQYQPLTKEDMKRVIEGRGNASRVPVLLHFWVHPEEFGDRTEQVHALLAQYPQDAQVIPFRIPDVYTAPGDDPTYRWSHHDRLPDADQKAYDNQLVIEDWEDDFEAFLADFPSAEYPGMFPHNPPEDGRYRLGYWWYGLFERMWSLRGMENALTDFYLEPDGVHQLFRKLTDFYKRMMTRAKETLNLDGVFFSDDLGTQNSTFFNPKIFDEFFAPYYRELISHAHALDMHLWLHSCGCITELLPKFIDMGLDVIHPIQKYTMEEREIAKTFGGQIAIWAGFDVQQIIPWGTPEEVAEEVRFMMETYKRQDGRFLFTAGNGVNGDCTLASLTTLFEEAFRQGAF